MADPLQTADEFGADEPSPEEALARAQANALAISRFSELAPPQRSAVILKDVLSHSVEEIAALLELSVPAVKAALHRGRKRLAELSLEAPLARAPRHASPALARFVELFNARDWDALRALLVADVELDVVSRAQRRGQRVSDYFSNYAALSGWHLVPGFVDGREAILAYRAASDPAPSYFIELSLEGGHVRFIRDFYFVPYILVDAEVEPVEG